MADAGLTLPATLMVRLGLESLINATVRLVNRVGGALLGRKVLTLVATILAGGSHIDHANRLRAGRVLGYHPLLATRADTGEVLHARLRKGSSQRGAKRFVEELVARDVRRASA